MSKLLSQIIAAPFYLALAPAAVATPPLTGNIIGKQAFQGPRSRGFHAACSAQFNVTNNIKGSANFTSTYWNAVFSARETAPVVNSAPVTAPDGTATAYQVTFPAVSGSTHYSVINQTTPFRLGVYPLSFGVWAQVASGAGNGTVYISMSVSTNFIRAAIPNDGAWHLVKVPVPTGHFSIAMSPSPQIGINLNDTRQAASSGAIAINLWNAFIIADPISSYVTADNISGPLATTSAAVTGTITVPCPPGVAFRDFREALPATGLSPVASNPIIPGKSNVLYQNGGVSNPYVNPPMYYNGYYWGFANATSTLGHTHWMSFALYKSKDGINWIEDTTNAPYLQTFGSSFASPTISAGGSGYDTGTVASGAMIWTGVNCPVPVVLNVTTNGAGAIATATYSSGVCKANSWPSPHTTWSPSGGLSAGSGAKFTFADVIGTGAASHWQLHPGWLPYGCNISGTPHQFCVVYSAQNPANQGSLFLAWSDTIDGVYTMAGCTTGTCAAPTPVLPVTGLPGVPSGSFTQNTLAGVVNVGGINGTNYIFTSNQAESGPWTNVWTTAANPNTTGAGTSLTWLNSALQTKVSGVDWDFGSAYMDNQVILNKCGFYEYFYTAYAAAGVGSTGKQQAIGYAVSNSPNGPWWKYNGPIIPGTSPMYFRVPYLGDSSPIVINGRFIWLGNYDDGLTVSKAVAAVMQDACSY
jgi:hypothetical protein